MFQVSVDLLHQDRVLVDRDRARQLAVPLHLETVALAVVPRQVGSVPVDRVASVLEDLAMVREDLGLEVLVVQVLVLAQAEVVLGDLDLGVLVEVQVAHLVDSDLGVLVEVLAALVDLDRGVLVEAQAEVVLVVLGQEVGAPQLLEEEGTVLAVLLGQTPEVLIAEVDFLTQTVR